jgi:hypothetical protein
MRLSALALALSALALAPAAAAAPRTDAERQAQVLFDEGMRLMAQKRFADACPKLERSQAIDPGMGTQFRLAECYEKIGRLATAYDLFHAVADAARASKQADRATVAEKRAAAIEPRMPRLTVDVPPEVAAIPGLEVRRDGSPLERDAWGVPQAVDAGEHVVEVQAPGRKPWSGKAALEGAARLSIPVPALEPVAPPPEPAKPRSIAPAVALGVVGAAGIVLGATFAGLRASRSSDATTLHDEIANAGGRCAGGGAGTPFAERCAALSSATSKGDAFGTASVVSFVVGGAALAGLVGWALFAPSSPSSEKAARLRVTPALGRDVGGVVLAGAF